MKIAHIYARFSLKVQGNGDSLRRQIERAETYARERGWTIAPPITDLGVSAYKGKNLTDGALGEFLAAVEAGLIPAGCVLIVESLDRLSRQTITDQFLLLLRIVTAGIELVTLVDEKNFTKDSINASPLELIVSLAIMVRAHDESMQKSLRISAAWQLKRRNAANRKLTARCPPWLEANPGRTQFIVDHHRAFAVKEMFRLAAAGYPPQMILNHMVKVGCQPWGKKATWTMTKVIDVLYSRAVLGEFQPHRMLEGKRVPDGEPIADYYPAIISPAAFGMAQRALQFDRGPRQGDANLFAGLAWDGQTGEPMVKRNAYLVNQSGSHGNVIHRWAYRAFEQNVLHQLQHLDWTAILEPPQVETEINRIEARKDELTTRLDCLVQRILGGDPEAGSLAKEINRIEWNLATSESKLAELRKNGKPNMETTPNFSGRAEIIKLVVNGDTDARLRLRLELRNLIERIELWPQPDTAKDLEDVYPKLKQQVEQDWGASANWPVYRIEFADGQEQWVICQRAKLHGDDGGENVCGNNKGVAVQLEKPEVLNGDC